MDIDYFFLVGNLAVHFWGEAMVRSLFTTLLLISCAGDISVIDKSNSTEDCESSVWYLDFDGDGFGGQDAIAACDAPEGYVDNNQDCSDDNAQIHPQAVELCNNLDDDCDEQIDEDAESQTWYLDADSDGFGDPNQAIQSCDTPESFVLNSEDCNDTDGLINPQAVELCNSLDDDCDNEIDEGTDLLTWYEDSDGDLYGNPDSTMDSCDQPSGYVENFDDCDDGNASFTDNCTPAVIVTETTCSSSPYTATGPGTTQPELHLFSAYEPANSTINVHIERNTQMVVVLSSYEPVHWVVTVDPGATVNEILLNGYHSQTLSAPSSIPYQIRSYDQTSTNFGASCGYSLPYNGGGCDTNQLLAGIGFHTGLDWTSFTGCYTASEFLLP